MTLFNLEKSMNIGAECKKYSTPLNHLSPHLQIFDVSATVDKY